MLIIVLSPRLDFLFGILQRQKPVDVEALRSKPAIEGFDRGLEPPTEFLVLARIDNNAIVRLRTFTPDCDIDGTGMPLILLNDVKPDDSLAWLASLVASSPDNGEGRERVAKTAIAAIALHNVPAAGRTTGGVSGPRSQGGLWALCGHCQGAGNAVVDPVLRAERPRFVHPDVYDAAQRGAVHSRQREIVPRGKADDAAQAGLGPRTPLLRKVRHMHPDELLVGLVGAPALSF